MIQAIFEVIGTIGLWFLAVFVIPGILYITGREIKRKRAIKRAEKI